MVDFEKIRVFYHVATEGSILRASSALSLSSPAISKHVSDLEKHLNTRLFIRKKKGLVLTESGQKLFDVAKHSVRSLETVTKEIEGDNAVEKKELRILTTTGVVSMMLMQRMNAFVNKHPDVQIRVYTQSDQFDFFNIGVDCAILPKVDNRDGLTIRKIGSLEHRYWASPAYIKKHGVPKNLDDLKNHRIIGFYLNQQGYVGNVDWFLKNGEAHDQSIMPSMIINNALTMIVAASQGYGLIVLPKNLQIVNELGFQEVLADQISHTIDYFYVLRNDEPETELLQEFYQYISKSDQG